MIISVATLPELSPTAIHESVSTYPPRENSNSRKGGRLLERFTKRIEGSHGALKYYLRKRTSTLFSISYYMMKIKGSDVLEVRRPPKSKSPLRRVVVKLLAPKRSSLHDAPRQPFAPNFQSPRVAMTS